MRYFTRGKMKIVEKSPGSSLQWCFASVNDVSGTCLDSHTYIANEDYQFWGFIFCSSLSRILSRLSFSCLILIGNGPGKSSLALKITKPDTRERLTKQDVCPLPQSVLSLKRISLCRKAAMINFINKKSSL